MICQDAQSRLIDFLEGDLDAAQQTAVEQHLSSCSRCQAIYQRERNTKLLLRARMGRTPAPEPLKRNILEVVGREDGAPGEGGRVVVIGLWKPMLAAAALLLIVVGVYLSANRGRQLPQLVYEEIDEHLRALASAEPTEIPSSDAGKLSNWFEKRLDFPLMVADLTKADAKLIGARAARVGNRDAACLAYEKDKRIISLFMVKLDDAAKSKRLIRMIIEDSRETRKVGVSRFRGQTVVFWLDGDILCTLVADMDKRTLIRLANTARSA